MAEEHKLTADDFEDIATRIAAVAENYKRVAEAMRKRNIGELGIFGLDTLESVTLLRINGPLASAQRALLSARKSTGKQAYKVAEDPEKLRVEREADSANRKAIDDVDVPHDVFRGWFVSIDGRLSKVGQDTTDFVSFFLMCALKSRV